MAQVVQGLTDYTAAKTGDLATGVNVTQIEGGDATDTIAGAVLSAAIINYQAVGTVGAAINAISMLPTGMTRHGDGRIDTLTWDNGKVWTFQYDVNDVLTHVVVS